MSDTSPEFLSGLNPEQLEAVTHEGSPLLILAGAGSGKTRVITTKIAWLVRERRASPESILAVTFTNKAAREMQQRAIDIEPACSRSMIRTFHSFGAWFLRRNAESAGVDPSFTIYDDEDSATLVHAILPSKPRNECSTIATQISRAKDLGLEPDSPELHADSSLVDPRIYAAYEAKLRASGNVDFGDLIRLPLRLLKTRPEIRDRVHSRFTTILVDEYQDSNLAQFELLKALAGPRAYVCVVGDDDQSIYRFRGAEVRNILTFPEAFPGTTIVKLTRNYRSYQSILDVAGDVVEKNRGRLGKELRAERRGGAKPKLAFLRDHEEEAAFCAQIAKQHVASGGKWADVAILYRTNAQSLSFERIFPALKIPYRIVGALRFYEREEIKDVLAFMSLAANPRDEIAFRRVVNKPSRGVGGTSVDAILSRSTGNLVEAAREGASSLRGRAKEGCAAFVAICDALSDAVVEPIPSKKERDDTLALAVERLIAKSGLAEHYRAEDAIAGTQKTANLDEIVNAATIYPRSREGLLEFLETIELDRARMAGESDEDALTLITIHNTKGLEFPVVIVTGLEQGLFPRGFGDADDLEEERRLFYVAITRAKNELYMTSCRYRMTRGQYAESGPSAFIEEMTKGRVEVFASKAHGRGQGSAYGSRGSGYENRYDAAGQGPRGAGKPGASGAAMGGWQAGIGAYHDDFGPGYVIKAEPSESGPVVTIRFETGKEARFMTRFTKKLTQAR